MHRDRPTRTFVDRRQQQIREAGPTLREACVLGHLGRLVCAKAAPVARSCLVAYGSFNCPINSVYTEFKQTIENIE